MRNGYGELRLINGSQHTGEQTRILAQREPAEYEPVVMKRRETGWGKGFAEQHHLQQAERYRISSCLNLWLINGLTSSSMSWNWLQKGACHVRPDSRDWQSLPRRLKAPCGVPHGATGGSASISKYTKLNYYTPAYNGGHSILIWIWVRVAK